MCLYYVEVSHLPTELSRFTGNSYFASCDSISWIKEDTKAKIISKLKRSNKKKIMGHGVLIALGLLIVAQNDDHYDNLLNQLKETVTVGTYYSEYGRKPQFYLLRGMDGDESTNKMYLFPSSSIVWTVQGDGSSVKYFHDDDGLQNPDTLIERIITAREDSQTKIDELFARIGLSQQQVQVIRFTETYE